MQSPVLPEVATESMALASTVDQDAGSALTLAQRQRIADNRERALKRKQANEVARVSKAARVDTHPDSFASQLRSLLEG